MSKDLSYRERQERRRYLRIGIIMSAVVLLLIVGIIIDYNVNDGTTYTAAQMLHDHDGDGIPDH